MPELQLKLFYAPQACSQVVHIAMEELGLKFDAEALAFMAGDNRAPSYTAVNQSGKVPTLLVDGKPLRETLGIINWLDTLRPGLLMPDRQGDALARAQDWSLLAWFAATAHPVFTRFRVPPAIIGDPAQFGAVAKHAAPVLAGFFGELAAKLGEGEWLLGENSAADTYCAWMWSEAVAGGFDVAAFPSLEMLRARVYGRPAAARALARESVALDDFASRGISMLPAPKP